jgi:SEFIR domain-containing protein
MASDPPKVLISYSHDSPEHEQRVLELADRLRGDGVDCMIDQYILVPEEGWPRWMDKQIRNAEFVLMVCTETYYQRVMGEEQPGKGLGVRWEGHLIYGEIYRTGTMNMKFIPVLFEGGDPSHIPAPARDTNHYFARTVRGYEDLYRRLTNQPRAIKQELGKLRSLPPAERKSEGAVGKLVNVPNLPPNFLPRPRDLQAVKDAVLAGLTKPPKSVEKPATASTVCLLKGTQSPLTFPFSGRRDTRRVPRHCSIESPGCPPQPNAPSQARNRDRRSRVPYGHSVPPVARLYPVRGFQR